MGELDGRVPLVTGAPGDRAGLTRWPWRQQERRSSSATSPRRRRRSSAVPSDLWKALMEKPGSTPVDMEV